MIALFRGLGLTVLGIVITLWYVGKILWYRTNHIAYQWVMRMTNTLYPKAGLRVEVVWDTASPPDDAMIALFGNHPDNMAVYGWTRAVFEHLQRKIVPVGRTGLIISPGIRAAGGVTFRQGSKEAAADIRTWANQLTEPVVAAIYPEGHRSFASRIQKARKKLRSKGRDDLADAFVHTLPPSAGGVLAMRQAMPNAVWVRVTVGINRAAEKVWHAGRLQGAVLTIRFAVVETPPDEEMAMRNWINGQFEIINAQLRVIKG